MTVSLATTLGILLDVVAALPLTWTSAHSNHIQLTICSTYLPQKIYMNSFSPNNNRKMCLERSGWHLHLKRQKYVLLIRPTRRLIHPSQIFYI